MRNTLQRPQALVEQRGTEFIVALIKPRGERSYYVSTGVDTATNEVFAFVTENPDKAKGFGILKNAQKVADDMRQYLMREYSNLVKWI